MQYAYIEFLLVREMGHAGHERLLARPILGPFGKGSVDVRIVNGWFAMGIFRNGQALPWHPGIEHPQDEIKEAMLTEFTPRTPLGHREVREDKFVELVFG